MIGLFVFSIGRFVDDRVVAYRDEDFSLWELAVESLPSLFFLFFLLLRLLKLSTSIRDSHTTEVSDT